MTSHVSWPLVLCIISKCFPAVWVPQGSYNTLFWKMLLVAVELFPSIHSPQCLSLFHQCIGSNPHNVCTLAHQSRTSSSGFQQMFSVSLSFQHACVTGQPQLSTGTCCAVIDSIPPNIFGCGGEGGKRNIHVQGACYFVHLAFPLIINSWVHTRLRKSQWQ